MKIKVNGKIYDVTEKELIVKNGRLYNTTTKENEGVEGDIITITRETSGKLHEITGTVSGYTCGKHAVIRPNYEFNEMKRKKIEHVMTVVLIESTDDEEALSLMTE